MQFKDNDDPLVDNFRRSDWIQAGSVGFSFFLCVHSSLNITPFLCRFCTSTLHSILLWKCVFWNQLKCNRFNLSFEMRVERKEIEAKVYFSKRIFCVSFTFSESACAHLALCTNKVVFNFAFFAISDLVCIVRIGVDFFFMSPEFKTKKELGEKKLSQLIKSNQIKLVNCLFTTSAKWAIH